MELLLDRTSPTSASRSLTAPESLRRASTAVPADRLDEFEGCLAGLASDHVAEQPPEQPDVVADELVVGADVHVGVGH